jgi:hypothetical protein
MLSYKKQTNIQYYQNNKKNPTYQINNHTLQKNNNYYRYQNTLELKNQSNSSQITNIPYTPLKNINLSPQKPISQIINHPNIPINKENQNNNNQITNNNNQITNDKKPLTEKHIAEYNKSFFLGQFLTKMLLAEDE